MTTPCVNGGRHRGDARLAAADARATPWAHRARKSKSVGKRRKGGVAAGRRRENLSTRLASLENKQACSGGRIICQNLTSVADISYLSVTVLCWQHDDSTRAYRGWHCGVRDGG